MCSRSTPNIRFQGPGLCLSFNSEIFLAFIDPGHSPFPCIHLMHTAFLDTQYPIGCLIAGPKSQGEGR